MRQRLLNILVALSLLLCVGTAALWQYSYWFYDAVGFWPAPRQLRAYGLLSYRGTLCFLCVSEGNGADRWAWAHHRRRGQDAQLAGYAGFVLRRRPGQVIVGVPLVGLTLLFAVPPAVWFTRRRRRVGQGCCRACGYDLRASPERCPECGTPVLA